MLFAWIAVATLLLAAAATLVWRMVELARLRADFTSSVSHELRTPLTQILLYAETMEMGRQSARTDRTRAARVITREAHRLLHLVENLLQFSRAERRLAKVTAQPRELGALVSDIVDAFAPIAAGRDARVFVESSAASWAHVDADAFRRILLNLLDNAIRYGPRGQTVVVRLEPRQGSVRVSVLDEGPGIAPTDRERVWRPFTRLSRASAESDTGCGIGLSIVRELTRLHGGRCGVEDAQDGHRGACFYVELPMVQPPVGVDAPGAAEGAPAEAREGLRLVPTRERPAVKPKTPAQS
jgi:signal transduction histidine kinase